MKYIFCALLLTCYAIDAMQDSDKKYGCVMYLAKEKVKCYKEGKTIFATISTSKGQDTNVITEVKKNTQTGETHAQCWESNRMPSLFSADDRHVTPDAQVVQRLMGKIAKMESAKVDKISI